MIGTIYLYTDQPHLNTHYTGIELQLKLQDMNDSLIIYFILIFYHNKLYSFGIFSIKTYRVTGQNVE